jgi:hypothetical protein
VQVGHVNAEPMLKDMYSIACRKGKEDVFYDKQESWM